MAAILISFAPLEAALLIGSGVGAVGIGAFILLEVARIKQQRKMRAKASQNTQKG
jgi:hypothetical protein